MDFLTDQLVATMLQSLDNSPVNPTLGERYLSCLVCKNLTDLGETGLAILIDMKQKRLSVANLPDQSMIGTCQSILKRYYSEAMFPENQEEPNLEAIKRFETEKANTAFRIYRAIRNNVTGKPDSKLIQDAVTNRDKKYFLDNFDKLFADVPFQEGLNQFKNFLKSPHVPVESQNTVWEFFEALLDIFLDEEGILEDMGLI
jgi:hypothetical protein